MKRYISFGIFVGTLLCSLSVWADTIILKDGKKLERIQVIDEDVKVVRYRYEGSKAIQTEPSENVETIEFSRMPYRYSKGWQLFQQGKYGAAAQAFERVQDQKFLPYARYYMGVALRKLGQLRQAAAAFSFFQNSQHRLMTSALFQLGEIYLEQKMYSQAQKVFQDLAKGRFSEYWTLQAWYGLGKALFLQKQYRQARQYYEKVQRKARGKREAAYQQLASLAQQAIGLCLVGEGNYRKAKRLFQKIITAKNATEEALAGAYLGLGKVYYNQKDYKKAVLCFLRVVIFFSAYRSYYEEAVKLGAKCFQALGQSDRAAQLRARLSQ